MAPRAQAELLQDVALKAEEACDGSYTAEAASGGDISFVLLLPPADACAEASKENKHNGDDKCS